MFLGHFAVALAAKQVAPKTSLGTLFFASQFLDLLWPLLLLAGIEKVRVVPGIMAATPLEFVHYPWSHSLLMVAVWAVLIAATYFIVRRDRRGAWILGAVALSHWLLDAPMHRPDLPLWPGSEQMVGGRLWDSLPLTLVIEYGLLAIGILVYTRATHAEDGSGKWGFWALMFVLLLAFSSSLLGAPPNDRATAYGALTLWLFVAWAWWVDRHRKNRQILPMRGFETLMIFGP